MALVVNDRVKETSTTTGTGTLSLAGAVTGFETFVAGIGNSNTTYYSIVNENGEFEVGLGTVTDATPDTLARTTVISSSNSDSAVNFSAGTKDVFCTLPASKAVIKDASGNIVANNGSALTNLNASNLASGTVPNARLDAQLQDVAGLSTTSGKIIQGDGSNFGLSAYTLPTSDGSSSQVLTTDGSGAVTFQTPTVGDITSVVAGSGLTGGATSGAATLNVGAGTGVTVNADDIAIGQSVATSASPTFAGLTTTADINFGDNDKAIFGAGSDLQIYHDPSEGSIVRDAGSGNLVLAGNDVQITNGARNETHIDCNNNGAVELYHDNSKKFETTSGGVAVTGDFTATGNISAGNNGSIFLLDNIGQKVGQLTNDSSSSHSLQIDADPDNSGANTYMQFKIDDSEKARIDANGNLLLNTSSASGFDSAGLPLIVGSGSTHQGITIFSGTSHQGAIHFADGTGTSSYRGQLNYKHDADAMTFATSGAEKARLDTNGTLLVGKTATNIGTAGIELTHDNVILGTRSGGVAQYLNRLSSDGSILELMKDGTTVGSIGVSSSDNLTFGATTGGGSGLLFYGAGGTSPIILPMKENAQIDNAVDLGGNGNAFKDLYLGGKVYVGSEIRTLSSSSTLSIQGGSTYPGAKIQMAGGQASSNPGTIIFSTDDGNVSNVSERARIDADGNFLVGKTSTTFATAGVNLQPNGRVDITRDGGQSGYFNRTNSDGAIVGFYKDGTSVGNIGAFGGNTVIGTDDTGLRFNPGGSADYITPFNVSSYANRSNAISLGHPAITFKDIYLGGGAYLGGTGSSNKLTDYEEGTWTPSFIADTNPTVTYNTSHTVGSYTKIGRVVYVTGRIRTNSVSGGSGSLKIDGLPFTVDDTGNNAQANKCGGAIGRASEFNSNTPSSFQFQVNTNSVNLQYRTAVDGGTNINTPSDLNNGINQNNLQFSLFYFTA